MSLVQELGVDRIMAVAVVVGLFGVILALALVARRGRRRVEADAKRLALLETALAGSRSHVGRWGEHHAIQSIIAQLEYLIGLASGRARDRSRLVDINLGVLAAREIEDRDMELATLLHTVSAEARRMAAE